MTSNDYYNKVIINLNRMQYELDQAIKEIQSKDFINIKNDNAAKVTLNSLYKLKEYFENKGFDLFDENNYLKFGYLSFVDAALEEISNCLSNMLTYSNSGLIERLKHRRLIDVSFKTYAYDFIALKEFKAEYIGRYIKVMLVSDRDFECFKPGMFYKYIVLVIEELKELGIDFTKDEEYIDIMTLIRQKEESLKNEVLDIEAYDQAIKDLSIEYNVDFVKLDKDYQFRIIENEDEVKKLSI